jgi:hypothetical protein
MTAVADIIAAAGSLVSDRAYRDRLPDEIETPTFPYLTISDDVAVTTLMTGDGRTLATRALIQVDVWQTVADEDDTLAGTVLAALNGLALSEGRLRLMFSSSVRLIEPFEDPAVAHTAITFTAAALV